MRFLEITIIGADPDSDELIEAIQSFIRKEIIPSRYLVGIHSITKQIRIEVESGIFPKNFSIRKPFEPNFGEEITKIGLEIMSELIKLEGIRKIESKIGSVFIELDVPTMKMALATAEKINQILGNIFKAKNDCEEDSTKQQK